MLSFLSHAILYKLSAEVGASERDSGPAGRGRWEPQNETVAQLVGEGGSLQMRLWPGRREYVSEPDYDPAGRGRWESPNETLAGKVEASEQDYDLAGRGRWEPQNKTTT